MDTLIIAAQLILSLSILVTLHECGHFFPAKWFKTRVEKFYLFFDPWFSLFKVKKGETEYGVGWLPLGGYVKIAGMIDESMDKKHLETEPQPWEFRSKPAWQRLIIMLGGVTVNFLLGAFIFAMILFTWGESYIPNAAVKEGIYVDSLGYELGLRDGDRIISVGSHHFDKFNPAKLKMEIIINPVESIVIERDGREMDLPVDPSFVSILSSQKYKDFQLFGARIPYEIAQVAPGTPAETAGLKEGDFIIGVEGEQLKFRNEIIEAVEDKAGQWTTLHILRDKDTLLISSEITAEGKIGVFTYGDDRYFPIEVQKYSFFSSIPKGAGMGIDFLSGQLKAFQKMFRGEIKAKESLGSVISIAKQFGPTWSWPRFWTMTASLSILLAFLNLLPIPGLDGGHVMFLLYEVATGRKPSDKVLEYATIVGFVLLIILMIYALGLDISRLF
ncbi:MAG TPA: RIP metalloprotease RseP [Saprospiraceae bacterium]|nr:RIP metalloprotease RseP [Saprospiraceae bacterium]